MPPKKRAVGLFSLKLPLDEPPAPPHKEIDHTRVVKPPSEERAAKARVISSTHFSSKQRVFLDFVLSHYVSVGVDELDQAKLNPFLRLKYHNFLSDAVTDLGKPEETGTVFSGFQKFRYQPQSAAQRPRPCKSATNRIRLVCMTIPKDSNSSQPLLIAHSGSEEDWRWSDQIELQLKGHSIECWTQKVTGRPRQDDYREALDKAQVVLVLVSPDLLPVDSLLDPILRRLREARGVGQIAVRPILIRPVFYGDVALLREVRPINQEALSNVSKPEAERYIAEIAHRILDLLRSTFRLQARELLSERPVSVSEHLARVIGLLDQAGPYLGGVLEAVQDIASYLLQEMLGSGAKASWQQDPQIIARIIERLKSVCVRVTSSSALGPYNQICAVIRCLRALGPADPNAAEQDPLFLGSPMIPLRLLPTWIKAARAPLSESEWQDACDDVVISLADYLAGRYTGEVPERPMPLVRIFHSLWFCINLIRQVPLEDPAVRTELAYVLRESLRFLAFGYENNDEQRRPSYAFDAGRYTRALRKLVAAHASHFLGPMLKDAIAEYLRLVSSTDGVNRYAPAEHIQHILELYMAGSFLLNVRLHQTGSVLSSRALTLGEKLRGATQHNPQVHLECQQAFILAALFHDVGHLFRPRVKASIVALGISALAREGLKNLSEGIGAAVRGLATTSVAALQEYVPDAELARWLEEQRVKADHGLLGAYYLHCLAVESGLSGWVLRSAIRAILLHNALDVPVSAERDPIAALLVMCDEIFEWDPAQPPAPNSVGRSLQVIAPDVPAHEPRDRWVQIDGLTLRRTDELKGWLDISAAPKRTWPTIHVHMQGPQRLALPVYKLWFRKSQNLGRIIPAPCGFGPTLVMESACPYDGKSNRDKVLQLGNSPALTDEVRPVLTQWIQAIDTVVNAQHETVRIGALDPALARGLRTEPSPHLAVSV